MAPVVYVLYRKVRIKKVYWTGKGWDQSPLAAKEYATEKGLSAAWNRLSRIKRLDLGYQVRPKGERS